MRKTPVLILFAAGLILLPCRWAGAEIEYQAGQGWTTVDSDGKPVPVEANAGAQLALAQKYEQAGDYRHAMVAYYALTRKFPRSAAAPDSQMKAAEMAVKSGDLDLGYTYYNEYLTRYPKGDDFDNALQGMYGIGQQFLAGARRRLFGVKAFPSMTRAQQIFENIVKVAPFSKLAPLAQFYVGQALEKQGKPEDAVAAYDEVMSRYPTDPAAADAQYQIGYVYLVQSRTAYDKTSATKAQEAFEDYLTRYPNSEKAAQAQDNLKAIQNKENTNAVTVAKYYDKKKNYRAAVIYYNEVIKEQPGSPDAKAAETRISAIKAMVGDAALDTGPEKPETGAKVQAERKLQAQVDTSARADYLGPPVAMPTPTPAPDQTAPPRPTLRSSPDDLGPAPEPPLPAQ